MKITKKELDDLLLYLLSLCERQIKEGLTPYDAVTLINIFQNKLQGLTYLFVNYPDALLSINVASDHYELMKQPYLIVKTTHSIECLDEHCLGC